MNATTFSMPEWEQIRMGSITNDELFRHFLFLGETGSGKTTSGTKPLCRLAFSPSSPLAGGPSAGLVVDPKGELGEYLATLDKEKSDRFIRLRLKDRGVTFWQFENEAIDGRDGNSIVNDIFVFSESYQGQLNERRDAFWIESSRRLAASLVAIDLALYRHRNKRGAENIRDFWRRFFGLIDRLNSADRRQFEESPLGDIVTALKNRSLASEAIDSLLLQPGEEPKEHPMGYQRGNYLSHIYQTVAASFLYGERGIKLAGGELDGYGFWSFFCNFVEAYLQEGESPFDQRQTTYFRSLPDMSDSTYTSIVATLNCFLQEFTSEEFVGKISINPFEPPENQLSVLDAIENGKVVVYTPESQSSVANCVGKVLKRTFFKALLVPERLNNPHARPFFYICDEFQRFITHDPESGEQSFLDRCRAYRVCCALATQSLAALHYVYPDLRGEHAINVLVTNTGTKMFFRTTDPETAATLRWLIPEPTKPGRPHLISFRPPSTLLTGECYYALVNGRVLTYWNIVHDEEGQ